MKDTAMATIATTTTTTTTQVSHNNIDVINISIKRILSAQHNTHKKGDPENDFEAIVAGLATCCHTWPRHQV